MPRLFRQKVCWLPTAWGWLAILTLLALVVVTLGMSMMPFLAPTRPVQGNLLVVEGWVPDYAFEEVIRVFRAGNYRKLLVTGTEVEQGRHISVEKSYAQLGASTLRHLGFEQDRLVVLASPKVERDRTYTTALAVRDWLRANGGSDPIDVFTIGPHARRTWILYKLALGGHHKVGVISLASQDYDSEHWWRSSRGFRETTSELIAYFYAKFLFAPGPN